MLIVKEYACRHFAAPRQSGRPMAVLLLHLGPSRYKVCAGLWLQCNTSMLPGMLIPVS